MDPADLPAPRALLTRRVITVKVTPRELWMLIEALQAKAVRAVEDPDQIDFADYLLRRVAELREASR